MLLVSDIDGTLLGDDGALEQFARWLHPRREKIRLVYNSGRFFDSVVESIRTTLLPEPDAIIGGVGTQIREYPQGWPIGQWHEELFAGWSDAGVRRALLEFPELVPQPAEFQAPHKVSYYLHHADERQLASIRSALASAGIRATVVYSSQRDLDVLPRVADKGRAAAWLARQWKISPQAVCASGDSANDAAMFAQGFRGIIVGNALPELKQLAGPGAYLARGRFAAGVQEGLEYWWPHLQSAARSVTGTLLVP